MTNHFRAVLVSIVCLLLMTSPLAAEKLHFAPDFILKDANQTAVSLVDYRNKEPVLLFFWTTWCPFCLKHLRILNDKEEEIKKDNLGVLAINIGEGQSRIARFAKTYRLFFTILLDQDAAVAQSYGVSGVPTYVLVDENGIIIYQGYSFPPYKKLLKKKDG